MSTTSTTPTGGAGPGQSPTGGRAAAPPRGGGRGPGAAAARPRATAAPAPAAPPAAAPEAGADPLHLWNRLKRTDPKATKPFTRGGGFRGTQIDPTWRLQMMTEVFGPVGRSWGWEQVDWTIAERMVFICARVWYLDPETGERCWTGPQWGGTEMVRRRNGAETPDDECFKMSMTDAVGKCLLQLGLAADVHMGQFDDSKYREESEAYYAAKANPDLQPAAIEAFEAEVRRRLGACLDLDDLEEVWRGGVGNRLRDIGTTDRAAQHRITTLFAQKKAEILERGDGAAAAGDGDGATLPPAAYVLAVGAERTAFDAPGDFAKALRTALVEAGKRSLAEVVLLWGANRRTVERSITADPTPGAWVREQYARIVARLQAAADEAALATAYGVPLGKTQDQGDDWLGFVAEIQARIAACVRPEQYEALLTANADALARMAKVLRARHKEITDQLAAGIRGAL